MARAPEDDLSLSRYERFEESHGYEVEDHESFDRVAFAMRALAILRPARLQVVVYQGTRELRVERGPRSHAAGPAGGEWAMVGIPPHASREHIAWGLAELAGVAHVPFMVDLLLRRASRHPYR